MIKEHTQSYFVLDDVKKIHHPREKKVSIPANIVRLQAVYRNNSYLERIWIAPSVQVIDSSCFESCINLKEFKFAPQSMMTKIPSRCFAHCEKLEQLVLPESIVTIESESFLNCKSLSILDIPKSVVEIAKDAFDGWDDTQTIILHSPFELNLACRAQIILDHPQVISSDDKKLKEESNGLLKKYAVECKCGHVGRGYYMSITFPVEANSKKEAARIARMIPRVKHHHKYAILKVSLISNLEYHRLRETNHQDRYLTVKSSYELKPYRHEIKARRIQEQQKPVRKTETITNKEIYKQKEKIRKPKKYFKQHREKQTTL